MTTSEDRVNVHDKKVQRRNLLLESFKDLRDKGKSIREIAVAHDLPESTVRALVQKGN